MHSPDDVPLLQRLAHRVVDRLRDEVVARAARSAGVHEEGSDPLAAGGLANERELDLPGLGIAPVERRGGGGALHAVGAGFPFEHLLVERLELLGDLLARGGREGGVVAEQGGHRQAASGQEQHRRDDGRDETGRPRGTRSRTPRGTHAAPLPDTTGRRIAETSIASRASAG